jgi:hypothetical protein
MKATCDRRKWMKDQRNTEDTMAHVLHSAKACECHLAVQTNGPKRSHEMSRIRELESTSDLGNDMNKFDLS